MSTEIHRILSIADPEERVAALCQRIDQRLEGHRLDELSRVEQVVHLVNVFDFETSLGGLGGLMYNSAGDLIVEMIGALREVGATSTAESMSQLQALLSAMDQVDRHDAFQALKSTDPRRVEEIESALMNCGEDLALLNGRFLESRGRELSEGDV